LRKPRKPKLPGKTQPVSRGKRPTKKVRGIVTEPAIFKTARKIALSLGDVEEVMSYGTPGFKMKGQLFARLHQDGESLVLRVDFEQREALMAHDPATYYITDHYLNYQWILVSLSRVHPDALDDLLRGASRLAAASNRGSSVRSRT
jgi:hypothetical protein